MGGGKSQTSTQTVSIPPEVLARYNAVNARAEATAQQPFQQYGGEFVAPLTPTQTAGIANTNIAATQAQPYYAAATGLTAGAAQNVGPLRPEQIAYYQNPFTQAVVNPTVQALQQQQGQQLAQQQAEAIRSGAAFGERSGLQRAQLQGQQNLAFGQAIAPLYQQGYSQAAQIAAGQQGVVASDLARQMQAAQQLAALGTGAQTAGLQGAQAQLQAGQIPQQTQQALDTALYQQFMQQQGYPFQVAQFLANIAEGTGALSGSTTTTTQPAGFFSDKRLKKDIKKIGKTNDGQPIYSYKYNGDDRTQIGLMAQDVEKKHPDAVGLSSGYKTVDYKKATEDSERPAKYAGGGLVPDNFDPNSMGGAVTPDMAGEGFARGGDAIGPYGGAGLYGNVRGYVPSPMQQHLEMMRPAHMPTQHSKTESHHFALGGMPYAGGYIPEAGQQQQRQLMLPPKLPAARPTGMSSAMETGKEIQGLYGMGKAGLVGSGPTKDDPSGSAGLIGGQGTFGGQNVFSQFKDWLNKPSAAAHGGLIVHRDHYDTGGDVDPYEPTTDPLKDVLKTQESAKHDPLKPGQTPGAGPSGANQLSSALGLGTGLMNLGSGIADFFSAGPEVMAGLLASGGTVDRRHYDDGGPATLPISEDVVEAQPGLAPAKLEDKSTTEIPAKMKGLVVDQPERNVAKEAIIRRANEAGVDPVLAMKIAGPESSYNARAQAGSSTAGGLFQIIDSTYKGLGGAPGKKYDPDENARVGTMYIAQNQNALRNAGFEPTHGNTYLAHFLGAGGATAVLSDPNKPLSETLSNYDQAAKANPFIRDWTGNDAINWANAKMSGKAFEAPPRPPGLVGAGLRSSTDDSSLLDKATSANFVVPALGFLGSMLASQRPTLGGAIGEGLLGGTGAYMAQQKQNAAMAKNVLDIVKDRFVISPDVKTGQTVYFNKATGKPISAEQYAQAVGSIADSLGVPRGVLGIPTAGTSVPSVSMPSAQLTQPAPQGAASAQAQPAQAQPSAGTKPATAADIRDMSPTQQKQYVIEHAAEYGLVDDRDPKNMQADINRARTAEQLATMQGNSAQAADFARQAADLQKRRDDYLTEAVSRQVKINEEIDKSRVASSSEFMKGVEGRLADYKEDRANLLRLADITSNYRFGRGYETKSLIGDWAAQAGIDLGPAFAAAEPDEAIKLATKQAIDNVSYKHLGRAPAAGIQAELKTVAGPNMSPGAAYSVIGRTIGEMDHLHARDLAYNELGRGADVGKFLAGYKQDDPRPFIGKAFEEIPVAKGINPDYVKSLEKTYNFKHKEPDQPSGGAAAAAPTLPPVPEGIRNLQGLSYSPSRNQYRDAQGNIYDATGKRVQ